MRSMGLQIVNFCKYLSEPADVNWLLRNFSAAHEQTELGQNLLVPSQGECRNENRPFSRKDPLDRLGQSVDFTLPRHALWNFAIAPSRLHDEHIRFNVLETRGLQDGLVPETNVP